jgi:hypothetical protein
MGWGIGVGIGWPNASSSNQGEMVYFQIEEVCGKPLILDSTTQLVSNSIYQPGDYVRYDGSGGNRVLLGPEVGVIGSTVFNIDGPIYTSCPV